MDVTTRPDARSVSILLAGSCLIAAPLFWAGNFVIARALFAEIPPVAFNFWRWFLAFLFLAPFVVSTVRHEFRQIVGEWRLCAILGVTGIALFQTFSYQAVHTTTALNAALYLSVTPIIVTAISWRWFNERLTRRQAVGIVVSLFGVGLVVTQADPAVLLALRFRPGDIWMIAAVPLWAVYSVLIQRRPAGMSQGSLLLSSIFFGLLLLAPLYAVELGQGFSMTTNLQTVGALLYVSLFASVAAFVFWQKGVSILGANKSSLFVHLIPLFSALLGFAFLGEAIWGPHLIGALFILIGIVLTTLHNPRPNTRAAAT